MFKKTKSWLKKLGLFYSIRTKILIFLMFGFAMTALTIILLTDIQVRHIIDQNQHAIYSEKIDGILSDIDRKADRLKLTGQIEAYKEAFQISLLKELRNSYYTEEGQIIYPFIIDFEGKNVLHPLFERGSTTLTNEPFVQKMVSVKEGAFNYSFYSEEKWCLIKSSQDWGWIVGYAIPLSVKYADVNTLRERMIALTLGIIFLISMILFLLIAQWLLPIVKLTTASKAMAEGDLDHEIEVLGHDEIGTLGRSFLKMRDSIKNQIHLLNGEIAEREQAQEEQAKLQKQLSHSQRLESVGRLAGGVAHDFNNMLAVIIGETELIMSQIGEEKPFYKDLQEIMSAAERSANLTKQLLAYARKQTVAPKVIDLNNTLEGMLQMLRRLIGENVDLAWMPGKLAGPLKIDPSQIDQMLANLCINARDAISGIGKITIETGNAQFDSDYCREHTDFLPGDYILMAVSDNGCGMDKNILAQIFDPFFTTKGLGKGTGLGLATTYGVVKQNNGFINVYSEPGEGSTFKIYLPLFKGLSGNRKVGELSRAESQGHETILVVEDEPVILKMASSMLEKLGYKVMGAENPKIALKLVENGDVNLDLLLTDVVMPEMNGRDLAETLKPIYPKLKYLFMSGYTANVIAHHGVLNEGIQFIQKPFSMKDLSHRVRDILDRDDLNEE